MNKLITKLVIILSVMAAASTAANATKAQDALEQAKSIFYRIFPL